MAPQSPTDAQRDGGKHRLFFALWPDAALRRDIDDVSARLEHAHAVGGRRLSPDRYHLTLQFLGDFRPPLDALLGGACAAADRMHVPPFELVLDCAGGFRGSRVAWLGTRQVPGELQQLWDGLGDALRQQQVPMKTGERFSPHLTLQRNVRRHLDTIPVEPLRWPVSGFVFIDSQPGQPYRIVREWALDG